MPSLRRAHKWRAEQFIAESHPYVAAI